MIEQFFEDNSNSVKLKDFLNTDMLSYAKYDNMRSIPKLTDGFKDSQRKAVFGLIKLCGNQQLKVSQLGEMTSEKTNYLHGGESLQGAIALMAQDYNGSNNYPLFLKDGQFGNRISPDSAAYRYIFVSQHENLNKLIKSEHDISLEYRFDEGRYCEPVTFKPLIPLWILNGSIGIGNGYSVKVYGRNIENIKKYIVSVLSGKPNNDATLFYPYFGDYKGSIVSVDESDKVSTSYKMYGVLKRINKTKTLIEDIPTKYYFDDYKKILNKLIDGKVIKDYSAITEENKLSFEIEHPRDFSELSDNEMMDVLKLVVPFTENVTLFDTNNVLRQYNHVRGALDEFIDWRVDEYEKFRKLMIDDITNKINFLEAKKRFITYWNNTKNVHKKSKEEILAECKGIEEHIDKFMALPISSLTEKQIDRLENQIIEMSDSLSYYEKSTAKQIYMEDLKGLK